MGSQIQLHYFERRHSSALASPKTTFVLRVSGFLGLLLALYLLLGSHSRTSTTPNFVPSQRAIQSYPATMAASSLKSVVANATGKHTATLIFSHGLGDTGAGWSFLAEQLAGSFPHVKFMFPNAPNIPITINGGYKMPGWFDVKSLRAPLPGNARGEEDEKGIMESVNKIHSLVDAEIEAGRRRFLAGSCSVAARGVDDREEARWRHWLVWLAANGQQGERAAQAWQREPAGLHGSRQAGQRCAVRVGRNVVQLDEGSAGHAQRRVPLVQWSRSLRERAGVDGPGQVLEQGHSAAVERASAQPGLNVEGARASVKCMTRSRPLLT